MPESEYSDLGERVQELRDSITRVGCDPERTTLVAVTKGFDSEAVKAAMAAGLQCVGENYAKEARDKCSQLKKEDHPQPRWHFIGQLQRNKVRQLAPFIHVWQTVDSAPLAAEIAKRAPSAAIFVQVNLTSDPGRGGCDWADVPRLVEQTRELGLDVLGLMGVAPMGEPEEARPAFRRLADLSRTLELPELSMGMSADFDVALEEGATVIRVGSALFGPRPIRKAHTLG